MSSLREALDDVETEFLHARTRFPPFVSYHVGIAVIREEYLELEREIFWGPRDLENRRRIHNEARQLAAMAVSLLVDDEGFP